MKLKPVLAIFVLLFFTFPLHAQYLNLQQHADFGQGRHYFTTTLEGVGVDAWGSWFGFMDADHRSQTSGTGTHDWELGVQCVYFELNRYFNLGHLFRQSALTQIEWTIQYNDSPAPFIHPAYLTGFVWDQLFSHYLYAHLEFLLRKEEQQRLAWQITGVWSKDFQAGQFLFNLEGYFDFWKNNTGLWWMAEPQFLINLKPFHFSRRFWMGTEWELNWSENGSYNQINPTLFIRYDF